MSDKESELYRIVDIVVGCCATKVDDNGTMSVTRKDVLSNLCRKENVVMTRTILAEMIVYAGYSVTTIAQLLHRTNASVRKMLAKATEYRQSSRAFRIAEAEATRLCNQKETN